MGTPLATQEGMFKRIVVGIDGTKESERSLPWVKRIRSGAEVVLVRFIEPHGGAPEAAMVRAIGEPVHDPTIDEMTAEADGELRILAKPFGAGARTVVRFGPGYPGLLEEAVAAVADLIVITTHGGSKAARRVFGGTTEKLMAGSNLPVLVVPPRDAPVAGERVRRILVPLDGSEMSERILPVAERLAAAHEAELVLVRVLTGPDAGGHAFAEADDRLKGIVGRLALRWTRARAVIRYGDVPGTILDVARDEKADLAVLSAHGHGSMGRLIFGSVAGELIRLAGFPVMFARHEALKGLEAALTAHAR